MINDIYKIYEDNKNIKYGWKDKDGTIHSHINEGYVKKFKFQSTDELLKSQYGNCWETVELTRELLNKKNIANKTYFFVIPMHKFYCHSIAVASINNKFYWIENSFVDFKGIREYNTLQLLIKDVLDNFHKIVQDKNINLKNIKIFEYEKPKEHIGCAQFYFHCFKQKNITKEYIENYTKNKLL